jgi:hypothetical protein
MTAGKICSHQYHGPLMHRNMPCQGASQYWIYVYLVCDQVGEGKVLEGELEVGGEQRICGGSEKRWRNSRICLVVYVHCKATQ